MNMYSHEYIWRAQDGGAEPPPPGAFLLDLASLAVVRIRHGRIRGRRDAPKASGKR